MKEFKKEGWVNIFKSMDGLDVGIKKSKLESVGIEAITFNHQDSMLTSLNDTDFMVSLYVHENDLPRASEVIQNILS